LHQHLEDNMAGLQNRYNTSPLSLMTTGGLGGGISREELIRLQKEREELERQRQARILAAGPARSSGAVPTVEINRALGYTGKQPGKGGAPTSVQMPNRQRVLNPEYAKSQQFGVGRGGAPVRMPGRPALSDRYQQAGRGGAPGMAESERDPWLTDDDAAFLLSLLDPILNPPAPPTPYGTFGGGGNKAWASLPFLMRGHS
jgi:hypothetical protein